MKIKNFRKLKYVSGNSQNAGFCTIYPTASGGLRGPQTPQPKFFSLASLAVLHLLFQNILLLLKVLKALDDIKIFRNITDGENKEILQDDLENLENWSKTWLLKFHPVKLSI